MAITFVGSYTALLTATSPNTIAFSNLQDASGLTPTLAQNDIVVAVCSRRNTTNTGIAPTTAGYTQVNGANVYANNTDDAVLSVYYKFMGATPDTSVDISTSGTTQSSSFVLHVFRGVDTTTPLDGVAPQPNTSISTGSVDPVAVTPSTAGAWVFVALACASANSAGSNTVFTRPANLDSTTNAFVAVTGTRTGTAGGFYSGWTSGSFDPAAPGGGIVTSGGSSASMTFVLKPAATIVLTGQSESATIGSLLATASMLVTGGAVTAAQGLIGTNTIIALVGQSVSVAQGTAIPTSSVGVIGQTFVAAGGLVTASSSIGLSGQTIAVSRDAVIPGTSLSLIGQPIAVTEGSVSSGSTPTVVALTGQSVSVSQKTLSPTSNLGIAGQPITVLQSTLSPGLSSALAGNSLIIGQGTASSNSFLSVLGQTGFVNQGDITPSRDVTVALVGLSAFIAGSSIGPQAIAGLVGFDVHATPGSPFIATSTHTPPGREILGGKGSNRALSGSPEGSRDLKGRQSLLADRGKVTD